MKKENFRILIPTNRSDFFDQICRFYKFQNLKVTIVHSFKFKNRKNYKKIKFIYYDSSVANRITYALKYIKEKYICIIGDDDFVFKDSVIESINFLKKNKNFCCAQGLHHRFEVKGKRIKLYPRHIKGMMKLPKDSSSSTGRIFQSFTYKFVDKFYAVIRNKDLYDIAKTSIPIENYSRITLEFYWIICCSLLGKSKILDILHCYRREHKKNDTKINKEKSFIDCLSEPKFREIFYNCLKNFYKVNKKKKLISKNILFFILYIFKLKIIMKGKFYFVRKIFEFLRYLKEQKLQHEYKIFLNKEKNKHKLLNKIVL